MPVFMVIRALLPYDSVTTDLLGPPSPLYCAVPASMLKFIMSFKVSSGMEADWAEFRETWSKVLLLLPAIVFLPVLVRLDILVNNQKT